MPATTTCINLLGQTVTVFREDHVGGKILEQGLYEKENLGLLLALLRRITDPVVLDIGANIGNHTLAFATAAQHVHAFEPIPMIHALLRANVEQNDLDNVTVHRVALSDTNGDATIHMVTAGNFGASSFDRRTDATDAVTVTKRRGDELLDELGITRVSFVKIDVEAHEVFVLRGLCETFARELPIITMEWNDPLTIERLSGSEELRFLFDRYSVFVLGSNYDRAYWSGRPLAFLRRKLTRLLRPRRAVLYPFNPARLYKNLLLIPRGKEGMLEGLEPSL